MDKKENIKTVDSDIITKPFYETYEFPELKIFDDNYNNILQELKEILEKEEKIKNNEKPFFELWCENNLYEESNPVGWNVAPLMINYVRDENRCSKSPFLMSLVDKIPGLITVSYSMLKPGTWIVPHKGYDNYSDLLLRYHMGLVVPKGDLGIRVDRSTKTWEEGKSFIFDDSLTHEAWNFSNQDRYVLIVDFSINRENKTLSNNVVEFETCNLTEEVKNFLKK